MIKTFAFGRGAHPSSGLMVWLISAYASTSAPPWQERGGKIMRDHAACRGRGRGRGRSWPVVAGRGRSVGRSGRGKFPLPPPSHARGGQARPGIAGARYILTLSGRLGREGSCRPSRRFNKTPHETCVLILTLHWQGRASERAKANHAVRPSVRPSYCSAIQPCNAVSAHHFSEIVCLRL